MAAAISLPRATNVVVFVLVLVMFWNTGSVWGVHYSHQWAVKIEGGPEEADAVAGKYGFINLGEILDSYYHFQHNGLSKRSASPSLEHHENLLADKQVTWAEQQVVKSRKKRDFLPLRPRSYTERSPASGATEHGVMFIDPRWPQMWYLNRGHGIDMNVQPAWQEGIIGRGVVVTILDDGLEKDHPDLARNYDPQASYDVNNHDENPMPRYDLLDSNRHGTRCAGEVAATANNTLCAVGVAFGASVGGVRMLDGDVTDAVEARSLSLNPQHIDIYSASWGPDDDGKTVDGPGELATRAFIEGVTRGRSGKGSIFVWASGNGGRDHDNCNCDGYTNSIWTLSISSATEAGRVPWYSEACSSTLATTYSSGSPGEKQVVTTDLHHSCTSGHTGTSASAPLAAGICALALEANKGLTWRDMQHIVVRTAKPANLKSPDWTVNGVGRNVSHSFGYGLMDASAMVKLARIWKTVPEQHKCEVSAPHADKLIPAKSQVILQLNVKECAGVNFLEHVQAKISLASSRRGDLQIHLTSPSGTRSTLLALRPHDISRTGFQSWPFMSVHTWGEQPFGVWQLEIHNEGRYLGRATLLEWALIFYGTAATPEGQDSPSQTIPPQRSLNRVVPPPSRPVPASIPIAIYPITTRKNKYTPRKNGSTKTTVKHAPLLVNSSRESTVKTSRPSVIEIRRPTMSTLTRMRVKSTTLTSNKPVISNTQTTIPVISSTWTGTQTDMMIDSQTHSSNAINGELTIFLEPHPSDSHPRVPDVFRKYNKVQSLYPMYPGSSSKFGQSSFRPALPNLVSSSDLLQDETPTRNKGTGTLSQWNLVLHGTDTPPHIDVEDDGNSNGIGVGSNDKLHSVEDDPEHNAVESATRGEWKEVSPPDHTRNDVQRTTTEEEETSSSGCLALSRNGQECIGLLCLLIVLLVSQICFNPSFINCPSNSAVSCAGQETVLVTNTGMNVKLEICSSIIRTEKVVGFSS